MTQPAAARFVSVAEPPTAQTTPAYWFLFQADKLLIHPNGGTAELPCVVDPAELGLATVRRQYLGYLEHDDIRADCYSAEIDPQTMLPDGWTVDNLRTLYPQLGELWFQLAGRAVQIVDWDRTHQFCGRCGAHMALMPHERAKQCPACGLLNYPRLSPAIIIAVVKQTADGNRLLLARNQRFPKGRYSVIAGFVEPGESLEECAAREVREEVGVDITNIRYFGSQPWPFPNSLMLGFTAEYSSGDITLEEAEIAEADWFAADALPGLPPKPSIARRLIDWFIATNS
jgi:NAD+ diphosphatase